MSNESRLRRAFQTLSSQARQGFDVGVPDIATAELPKVAKLLKHDRVHSKPPIDENLVRQWTEAVSTGKTSEIPNRTIRFLSWEPEIVHSGPYINELETRSIPVGRSLSKGLAHSIMAKWHSGNTATATDFLKNAISRSGTTSYLEKVAPFVLDRQGPYRIADQLTNQLGDLSTVISEFFGLMASSSEYATAVLYAVIERSYSKVLSANIQERSWFYNQILANVNKDALLKCLEMVVSAIDQNQDDGAKEELKRFVLFHPNLGDPRLPGYEGNWPRDHAVTTKVIEWLSQSDIRFFFDLFIEKKSDNQGRKQFWLKYAHRVRGSRVIVSDYDQHRFARPITAMKQKSGTSNLFATLAERTEKSTAFMMDFGNVIVVEFSQSGHACYYYPSNSNFKFLQRAVFWNTSSFSISDLKRKGLCPKPLRHVLGWEQNFSNELARFGLRPASGGSR